MLQGPTYTNTPGRYFVGNAATTGTGTLGKVKPSQVYLHLKCAKLQVQAKANRYQF